MRIRKSLLLTGICAVVLAMVAGLILLSHWNLLPQKTYTAQDFGITPVLSGTDCDGDGIDDYTDILLSARADARRRPKYDTAYFPGGYPPEDVGVCTDLIWRALAGAGYSLKDLVDADIAADVAAYPGVKGTPDPNIDFRRVNNLKVFFERNTSSLTLDPFKIKEWQPGDIVTFAQPGHIAIISDRRNRRGIPYIIHHGRQPAKEEDALLRHTISGHFRFILKDE